MDIRMQLNWQLTWYIKSGDINKLLDINHYDTWLIVYTTGLSSKARWIILYTQHWAEHVQATLWIAMVYNSAQNCASIGNITTPVIVSRFILFMIQSRSIELLLVARSKLLLNHKQIDKDRYKCKPSRRMCHTLVLRGGAHKVLSALFDPVFLFTFAFSVRAVIDSLHLWKILL